MKIISPVNRRSFLKTGLLGATTLAAAGPLAAAGLGQTVKPERDPWASLKMGMASYSLRKFNLDEAIAMTRQAGLTYISLKDVHLPFKSTSAERATARQKVQDAGLVLLSGGVIYMKNNEEEIRGYFEYAKEASMPTIVCAPEPAALDTVEKMVKQFEQRIAIHNHGPDSPQYPSPLDVLSLIQERDARMGICMDVGHTVRLGQDPVAVIQRCSTRLYDFHMKDVTAAARNGSATEVGKGVIDIVAVLRALLKMNYPYHVGLEYEAHADAPMPGIVESLAYMRGVLAAI
jgi:sugar phosphate isomerase/epimerase